MPITAKATPGSKSSSPKDHALILIDFQSQMAFATHSIDAITLRNNAGLVARAAASFKVPAILTTVAEKSFSGPMFAEVTDPFPGQEFLDRTSMNTWGKTRPSSSKSISLARLASCSPACGPRCVSSVPPCPPWSRASRCTSLRMPVATCQSRHTTGRSSESFKPGDAL